MHRTIYTLLAQTPEHISDYVFEAWLDSDDASFWTADDVRDRCAEDTRREAARDHFGWWFENYLSELPDPYEVFTDEVGAEIFFERSDAAKEYFIDAVFESLDCSDDYYRTLMGLLR